MITLASELDFYQIEGVNAPIFTCARCGRREQADGWFMADIPYDEEEAPVRIVACSDSCVGLFKLDPSSDSYIASLLQTVTSLSR